MLSTILGHLIQQLKPGMCIADFTHMLASSPVIENTFGGADMGVVSEVHRPQKCRLKTRLLIPELGPHSSVGSDRLVI